MIVHKLIPVCFLFFATLTVQSQILKNTSYKNQSGEKVLRFEFVLPVSAPDAWKLFTTDEALKKWMAPLAHIELKAGGYILTNYDTSKSLSDSSSIKLPITSFIDNELLVLKVILNDHFVKSVRESDANLKEVIQFIKRPPEYFYCVTHNKRTLNNKWGSEAPASLDRTKQELQPSRCRSGAFREQTLSFEKPRSVGRVFHEPVLGVSSIPYVIIDRSFNPY